MWIGFQISVHCSSMSAWFKNVQNKLLRPLIFHFKSQNFYVQFTKEELFCFFAVHNCSKPSVINGALHKKMFYFTAVYLKNNPKFDFKTVLRSLHSRNYILPKVLTVLSHWKIMHGRKSFTLQGKNIVISLPTTVHGIKKLNFLSVNVFFNKPEHVQASMQTVHQSWLYNFKFLVNSAVSQQSCWMLILKRNSMTL